MVKGKSESANLINSYLIQVRNKIYEKEIELIKTDLLLLPHYYVTHIWEG
jgi:hypothetical protein